MEPELQDAEGAAMAYLAIGLGFCKGAMIFASSTDHKLAYAPVHVFVPVWILGRKALVTVIVTREDEFGSVLVECPPERLEERV